MAADQFWHVRVLDDTRSGENLDGFMKRKVFPDEIYKRKSHELVERLKLFVQHSTPYSVRELFVGGSLGKTTNILDSSDVDLMMFTNDYKTMDEFRSRLPRILDDLEKHVRKDFNWAREAKNLGRTKFTVQFEVTLPGYQKPIKVDLLPALDLLATKTVSSVYDEMKYQSTDEQRNYCGCLSKRQTEFVRDVPVSVKNLIRLVKYWKETNDVPLKSYAAELIIIHLWREWGQPQSFSMKEKFQKVMEALADFSNIRVLWEDRYDVSKYRRIPPRPVLLDAANPFINLAPPRQSDVNAIMSEASRTLQRMR